MAGEITELLKAGADVQALVDTSFLMDLLSMTRDESHGKPNKVTSKQRQAAAEVLYAECAAQQEVPGHGTLVLYYSPMVLQEFLYSATVFLLEDYLKGLVSPKKRAKLTDTGISIRKSVKKKLNALKDFRDSLPHSGELRRNLQKYSRHSKLLRLAIGPVVGSLSPFLRCRDKLSLIPDDCSKLRASEWNRIESLCDGGLLDCQDIFIVNSAIERRIEFVITCDGGFASAIPKLREYGLQVHRVDYHAETTDR